MRRLVLVAVLVTVLVPPALAENTVFRALFIGGKKLSNHWNLTSVNFVIRDSKSLTAWSFFGPRYKSGDNYLDLFIGCKFPEDQNGVMALSPRFQLSSNHFYIWQDFEWYPQPEQVYTETKLRWKATSILDGLDLGLTFSSFIPSPKKPTIWNIGPEADIALSDKMVVGLTWQYQREEFGGNYVRVTTLFLFF